jgi:hypothetical protein
MNEALPILILAAGVGQLSVLVASALVPFRLDWRHELASLSKLHRQMYWVYGGYVVLSIIAFGLISIFHSAELANGSALARSLCLYIAVFWAIRLALQGVFDVKAYLSVWWLKLGYRSLTVLFTAFTVIYAWTAVMSGKGYW